jgi:hypothetical protein
MKTVATLDFLLLIEADSYAQAEDMPVMVHVADHCRWICSQTASSSTDC